ncbi:hypothetical protein DL764_003872 [Monosporascus ibericus]|uniref:TM7S3/TM198-like domain-containing protein n=1 Tax=Monosporascus ibericus TaxID=155417 RepID=A0A4V1XB86_9PEZI|nr:hypothetical protein DL764_003872 [Monosporascus ibericus]
MIVTGATYTLIGIKSGWLHTFFSSAFLTSLCTAILIVYVMVPPIRDAIQGAYVVAVLVTGLVLGGAATLFRELTEGFGCLLGGFCLSMWLLTLKEGGLLPGTTQKIIFICAFTLGGYAFYFSHYTRGYAMIGLMSFAGATVTVLGIDCFTQAGLKEYWAYIWDLNKDLFPLSATTYPQTKVIRVETALIVIFTVLGVISQLKLWRVVQERRATRAAELEEEKRQRDLEEANVGQQIEEETKRERRQWEATYGDQPPSSPTASGDSGLGDMKPEKKAQYSQTTVPVPVDDDIELDDLPSSSSVTNPPMRPKQAADGLVIADQQDDNSRVTVRVARDEEPVSGDSLQPMPAPDEKVWIAGADGEGRPVSKILTRNSQRFSLSAGPDVVPLPFRIPDVEETDERDEADRSSFATFADEDARSIALSKRASRGSLGNRLSVGSANLLRSLSGRSQRSQASKRRTRDFASPSQSPASGESQEDLVSERRGSNAEVGSVAATVDGMSEDDTERPSRMQENEQKRSIEIKAELVDRPSKTESTTDGRNLAEQSKSELHVTQPEIRPHSTAETVGSDSLNPSATRDSSGSKLKRSSTTNALAEADDESADAAAPTEEKTESVKKPRSTAASMASSRVSLTKDRLPSGLSRVALSYRTNEWAKHLSHAEAPEPEKLQLNEYPEHEVTVKKREPVVPVNVEELQQTAQGTLPGATMARTLSSASKAASQVPAAAHRPSSRATMDLAEGSPPAPPALTVTAEQVVNITAPVSPVSSLPASSLHGSHSFRIKHSRRSSTDVTALPIAEENGDEHHGSTRQSEDSSRYSRRDAAHTPSPTPDAQVLSRAPVPGVVPYASPQTLLGQREMLLRHKSQSLLAAASPIPEHPERQHSGPPSETGSLYNYRSSPTPVALAPGVDDIPLSQRKELIRQSSLLSAGNRPNSTMPMHHQVPRSTPTPLPQITVADAVPSNNSHQPQRLSSAVASPARRESQLANFRNSVAADLRAGAANSNNNSSNGRDTPLVTRGSAANLVRNIGRAPSNSDHRDGDFRRSIDRSRSTLLSQMEAESQRRELERWEKERSERAFEERMRSGDLLDAHREAMRKLQGGVKDH